MLDSLAPARRRLVLASLGIIVLGMLLGAIVVATSGLDSVDPVPQGEPGRVVLVTGYGGDLAALDPLTDELDRTGRSWTVVAVVGSGTGDIDAQAEALDRTVDNVLDESGAGDTVDVIGYSMGGLVARSWVRNLGGDAVARRVLTIGSPHHGTESSNLALDAVGTCPPACVQMAPGSRFLARLNAGDESPPGPQWVTVWSEVDQVVVPPESSRLAGALDFSVQSVCPGSRTSHRGLPADAVVLAAVSTTLGAGDPAVPAVTC